MNPAKDYFAAERFLRVAPQTSQYSRRWFPDPL
jgi:hypothetical protein